MEKIVALFLTVILGLWMFVSFIILYDDYDNGEPITLSSIFLVLVLVPVMFCVGILFFLTTAFEKTVLFQKKRS